MFATLLGAAIAAGSMPPGPSPPSPASLPMPAGLGDGADAGLPHLLVERVNHPADTRCALAARDELDAALVDVGVPVACDELIATIVVPDGDDSAEPSGLMCRPAGDAPRDRPGTLTLFAARVDDPLVELLVADGGVPRPGELDGVLGASCRDGTESAYCIATWTDVQLAIVLSVGAELGDAGDEVAAALRGALGDLSVAVAEHVAAALEE